MNNLLIIYDKIDIGFNYTFMKEIGFRMYDNFKFKIYDDNHPEKMSYLNNHNLSFIFIAIWDTNKVIKCVSNINPEIISKVDIYSVCTTDLTQFSVKPIIIKTSDNYFIEVRNETLFGKAKEIAIPIENISCYDYDNKNSCCLDENTKISYFLDASSKAYVPGYGIEKDTQWRKNKEEALEFSNLALREALIDKKELLITPDKYIVTMNNQYASYNSFKVNLPTNIILAMAGIGLIDNDKLEINYGKSAAILLKCII